MTQKEIILDYLKYKKDWTPSWELIKNDTPFGWIGSGSDRIARYMVKDGVIEREDRGKYAYYRVKQEGQLFLI